MENTREYVLPHYIEKINDFAYFCRTCKKGFIVECYIRPEHKIEYISNGKYSCSGCFNCFIVRCPKEKEEKRELWIKEEEELWKLINDISN